MRMAVKYVQEKNNTLGALGTLAQVAGMATGAGWLIPFGMGLNALDAAANGDSQTAAGTLGSLMTGMNEGKWINPGKGNIAKASGDDKETASKWAPYSWGASPFGNLWSTTPNMYPSVNPHMWGEY